MSEETIDPRQLAISKFTELLLKENNKLTKKERSTNKKIVELATDIEKGIFNNSHDKISLISFLVDMIQTYQRKELLK